MRIEGVELRPRRRSVPGGPPVGQSVRWLLDLSDPSTPGKLNIMTDAALHYPAMPPQSPDEDDDQYTNRLLGIGQPSPYNHHRNRQCSIGYHSECSQRIGNSTLGATGSCECPHHADPRLAAAVEHIAAFARAMARNSDPDVTQSRLDSIEELAVDVTIDALAAADRAAS